MHEKFAFHISFRMKLVVYNRKLISVDFVYVGLHEQFKKSISDVKLTKHVFLVYFHLIACKRPESLAPI